MFVFKNSCFCLALSRKLMQKLYSPSASSRRIQLRYAQPPEWSGILLSSAKDEIEKGISDDEKEHLCPSCRRRAAERDAAAERMHFRKDRRRHFDQHADQHCRNQHGCRNRRPGRNSGNGHDDVRNDKSKLGTNSCHAKERTSSALILFWSARLFSER